MISIKKSKKRIITGAALLVLLSFVLITHDVSLKVIVAIDALLFISGFFSIKSAVRYDYPIIVVTNILAACFTCVLMQETLAVGFNDVFFVCAIFEILICISVSFFFQIVFRRPIIGVSCSIILMWLYSVADYYVYLYRGNEISPNDFIAIRTAVNVLPGYDFSITREMLLTFSVFVLFVFVLSGFECLIRKQKRKTAFISSIVSVSITFGFFTVILGAYHPERWDLNGARVNTPVTNLIMECRDNRVKKPTGYNVNELQQQLDEKGITESESFEKKPNVIAIMNESFSDLEAVGSEFGVELNTDTDVLPFFNSLSENTIRGFCYSSVMGAGTSCSEYEFLTGNTMAFLPLYSSPYSQFVNDSAYSMVSVMNRNGYQTCALHPFYSSGWNRINAWPDLGFDHCYYLEDFPQADLIRGFVSDKEMYEKMIALYEERDKNKPLFMFGVTMQNHGGYMVEDYQNDVTVKGFSQQYSDLEQYLSLIKKSDEALRELIEYCSNAEEDIVLVFFGDHLPTVSFSFYDELLKGNLDAEDLNNRMAQFMVPFVIWANYDIQEKEHVSTSLNYLQNYLYNVIGYEAGSNNALEMIQEEIPIINATGYYSKKKHSFLAVDAAKGREKQYIELYKKLQYNNAFDKNNKLPIYAR